MCAFPAGWNAATESETEPEPEPESEPAYLGEIAEGGHADNGYKRERQRLRKGGGSRKKD